MAGEEAEEKQGTEEEERLEELARPIRRAGYLILLGLVLLLVVPMIVGGIQGIRNDQVWDPLTGSSVSSSEGAVECQSEAGELIYMAGSASSRDQQRWEQRYRRWLVRCRQEYPNLLDLLNQTRERMHRGEMESGDITEE